MVRIISSGGKGKGGAVSGSILEGFVFRPEILKQEMKVFFVKYNDPIYVKMEKLDIMIRLAQQSNISQVLSELKE